MQKMIQFRILIQGQLSPEYADWFEDVTITVQEDENTVVTILSGTVADQAALHGLLNRIRDLDLTLLSIESEKLSNTDESHN